MPYSCSHNKLGCRKNVTAGIFPSHSTGRMRWGQLMKLSVEMLFFLSLFSENVVGSTFYSSMALLHDRNFLYLHVR